MKQRSGSITLLILIILLFICSNSAFSLTFAVLGDNRDGDATFKDIIQRINQDKGVEFVINTGDLTSKGTKDEYAHYFDMTGKCRAKFYDCLGNHDIGQFGSGKKIFKGRYGNTYYYFDIEGSRFIVLDNNERSLGRKQVQWLENALKFNGDKYVVMHKPLFDPTGNFPKYIMANRSERNMLFTMFRNAKVKYIFTGHIHGYGKGYERGLNEILSGGAGAPLYLPAFNGGYNHYVRVTAGSSGITDEVIRVNK